MDSPAEQLGSGIAVLAEDEPSWSDGPFQVQGVALPEDVTMQAANEESLDRDEDVRTYYPAETVEEAAALFEGRKIVDGREHDLNSVLENPSQPLPETIVGEITSARYKPGVGVVYEGEVDDPDIAKLIERDRVEVSPTVFRELGDEVDDNTFEAQEVAHVRDLSVVAEGAGDGNSIRPAAAAMTAEALRQEFSDAGAETLKTVAGVTFTSTATGQLDESGIPNDDYESHYLFPGDTKSESSYPVVDGEGDLRRGNVESAFSVGARGGVSESELHSKLRSLNEEFSDPPIDPEKLGAETASEARQGDDGTAESPSSEQGQSDKETSTRNMSEETELTRDEQRLLDLVDDPETAAETLQEIQEFEEPCFMESSEYETHCERVEVLEELFDEKLTEQKGLREATVEAMSFEAKASEFEDEDGELNAEVLVQEPETGEPEQSEEPSGPDDEDRERIEEIDTKISTLSNALPRERIKELQAEACELAGTEDYEAAVEVL